MKADKSQTQTFPASMEQYTTNIDSQRMGAEELPPPKETLLSADSAEAVRLLRSLTPYTSNRTLHEFFFAEPERKGVPEFLDRYQPYDHALIASKRNRFALLQLSAEKYYVGEVFNGKCHGVGIMVFSDGRMYEGLLENNIRQGEGLFVLPDQSWFFGEYSNDKKDGFGTELNMKYRYQGQYVNGMKHGHGVLVEGGTSYIGEWEMGAIQGQGILETSESRYEGQFSNFKKHGSGRQVFTNEDEYTGSYSEGKPHGQGQYHWSKDQCHFTGNFEKGQRSGKGQWISATGDRYSGHYQNDLKDGYGEFYWRSGNVYKGHFKNDLRHGFGEMYWRDGTAYKGQWHNGIQHGRGTMVYPSGEVVTGMFDQNVLISRETTEPAHAPRTMKAKSFYEQGFRKQWKRTDSVREIIRGRRPTQESVHGRTAFLLPQQIVPIKEKNSSQTYLSHSRSKSKNKSGQKKSHKNSKDHNHSPHELSPGGHHRCRACAMKQQHSAVDIRPNQKRFPAVSSNKTTGKKIKPTSRPDSTKKNAVKFYMRYQAAQYLKFKF